MKKLILKLAGGSLRTDIRGVTAVEFALVSPVLILGAMGMFDIGHQYYAQSILQGEVQKAGRLSSFEDANSPAEQAVIDGRVATSVRKVVGGAAQISFTRKSYNSYRRATVVAEDYVDNNKNGVCDNGEPFEDSDGSGSWSSDASVAGQGSAKDVLVYSAFVSYGRLFPMAGLLGWSPTIDISANTTLRNQPFTNQREIATGNCP
jgi:hypothetical protein